MVKIKSPDPLPPPPQAVLPSNAAPASPAPLIFRKSRRLNFLPADTPEFRFSPSCATSPFYNDKTLCVSIPTSSYDNPTPPIGAGGTDRVARDVRTPTHSQAA